MGSWVNRRHKARRTGERRFSILCVLGYVALSWAVRFDMDRGEQIASLLYPLDTFSMYAQAPSPEISHLLVRDAHGTVHSVAEFRSFDCEETLTGSSARCSDWHPIRYLYEESTKYIESHPGEGTEDIDLILRTWSLRPGAPVAHESDCVITNCRVSR